MLTFRIGNPNSERLKQAVERLVDNLNMTTNGQQLAEAGFKLDGRIEVYMPNSVDRAYSGKLVRTDRFAQAREEKHAEWWIGIGAYVVAVGLLAITYPPFATWWMKFLAPGIDVWVRGLPERLSTAFFSTSAVSIVNVIFHWLNIRRKSRIDWWVE